MIIGYLIRDWTEVPAKAHNDGGPYNETKARDKFVHACDIWEELDEAKKSGRKIAVFEIDKCLLDWS